MTIDYRAAVDELLNALCKVQDWDGTRVGDAMDAVERATLTQPEPEHHPTWTEGVCGEGAAILKDGVMQPIEDVIAALNATTLAQPEPSADGEVAELADRLGWIAAQLGDIGWGDDSASVARAANLLQQQAAPVPVPVAERLPGPEDCASWPDEPDSVPWAWAGKCVDGVWEWTQLSMYGLGLDTLGRIIAGGGWTHWFPHHALPIPASEDS